MHGAIAAYPETPEKKQSITETLGLRCDRYNITQLLLPPSQLSRATMQRWQQEQLFLSPLRCSSMIRSLVRWHLGPQEALLVTPSTAALECWPGIPAEKGKCNIAWLENNSSVCGCDQKMPESLKPQSNNSALYYMTSSSPPKAYFALYLLLILISSL